MVHTSLIEITDNAGLNVGESAYWNPQNEFEQRIVEQSTQFEDSREHWKNLVKKNADALNEGILGKLITRFEMLYETEDWELEDRPVLKGSSQTSMLLIRYLNPTVPPKFGCNSDGQVIIYWKQVQEYAKFTCFPRSLIRWYVTYRTQNKQIELAGEDKLRKLKLLLGRHRVLHEKLKFQPAERTFK